MHILLLLIVNFFFLSSILPLEALGVREVRLSSTADTSKSQSREDMIQRVLSSSSFFDFTRERLDILISGTLVEPRGRMTGRSITLSSGVSRDSEFLKLFTHELGHFVDIYILVMSGDKDVSS